MRKHLVTITSILIFMPIAVSAHIYMLEQYPPEKALLPESPEKVTITFAGSVEPMFSKIEVIDERGKKVSMATTFRENDTVMETELTGDLPDGTYTVRWLCVSLDGHKQKGEYHFTIRRKE